MGLLRYLPKLKVWKNNIIHLERGTTIERDYLVNQLYDMGYERESIVAETGKLGVRGYVLDVFPVGMDNPVRVEFWGDEVDSIKTFDLDSQLSLENIDTVDICPYTEFLLEEYKDDMSRKQKYLKHYSKEVGSLWNYVGGFKCFYYDYNQIEEGYRILRETIINYDKDNQSTFGIQTDYMFDIKDINFEMEVFLMNFDNMLPHIKLSREDKFISGNIDNYNGNIEQIKVDLKKYLLHHKTVVLCVNNDNEMARILKYMDDFSIFKTLWQRY